MTLRSLRLVGALMCLMPAIAFAGSSPQTSSFGVSAQVNASCLITSTTDMAFGAYDPLAVSDLDATGAVVVRCSQGTSNVKVALDQGANPDTGSTAAAPLRQMASGSDRLGYQIYSDASRSTVWGGTAATAANIAGPMAASAPVTLTTYGRISAGSDVAAGSYSDTVGVTVTF